jgi:hypothetical protein
VDSTGCDIQSLIPSTATNTHLIFSDYSPLGEGALVYDGTYALQNGTVSTNGWNVNSSQSEEGINFDFFYNKKLPQDVRNKLNNITTSNLDQTYLDNIANGGDNTVRGFNVWYYDGTTLGDLNLNGNLNFTTSGVKVILLVNNAGLNIKGKITYASGVKGKVFFMALVKGDITVDAGVGGSVATPDLEGVFYTDGEFHTGSKYDQAGGINDDQLHIRGVIVAKSLDLKRNLGTGNSTKPGEIFEFAPDQVLHFPSFFSLRTIAWSEIAP